MPSAWCWSTIYGMLNFTPMVLLPPLLQQHAGFPDTLVGEVIGSRGVGMTARLSRRRAASAGSIRASA